jgi:hypothetical protein
MTNAPGSMDVFSKGSSNVIGSSRFANLENKYLPGKKRSGSFQEINPHKMLIPSRNPVDSPGTQVFLRSLEKIHSKHGSRNASCNNSAMVSDIEEENSPFEEAQQKME